MDLSSSVMLVGHALQSAVLAADIGGLRAQLCTGGLKEPLAVPFV